MTTTEINRRFSELNYRLLRIVVSRCDELPITYAGKIVIYNSEIFFWNGTAYERMLTEDDIAGFVTESELAWLTQNIQDGLVNADAPTTLNPFATMQDLLAIGVGTNIFQAANYSALPAANLHSGEFYWVEAAQGTQWLPGSLGGTYYPLGLYYSNGATWTKTDSPYQATQPDVDAGLNDTKFVTPFTLQAKIDDLKYSVTLPSTLTHTVLQATHGLTKVSGVNLYSPTGDNISIAYNITSNNVTINSNINLLNHILEIY